MTAKKERILWALCVAVLAFLFLLSSTDLIFKEKEQEIYAISVIVEDASDDNYVNFRKGMDQAAMDFHADVRFITLYEAGNQQQQRELMIREQQDGSRALIVQPVDEAAMLAFSEEKRLTVPVVLLNSQFVLPDMEASRVAFDYAGMGKTLAEQMLAEQNPDDGIHLLFGEHLDEASRQFYDGIREVLEQAGSSFTVWQRDREAGFGQVLQRLASAEKGVGVLIALDQGSLLEVAKILDESGDSPYHVAGLYGRGTSVPILNYLDRGVIQGLCVTDDYSAGYLSVKTAVCLVENGYQEEPGYVKSACIRREDLRSPEFEKMLYPIE